MPEARRRPLPLVAVLAALVLSGCTDSEDPANGTAEPVDQSSSPAPSAGDPTVDPDADRQDLPITCFNVVTETYRDALVEMGAALQIVSGQVGLESAGLGEPVPMTRSMQCLFSSPGGMETVVYGEFDADDRQTVIDELVLVAEASGTNATPQPAPGVDDAVQLITEVGTAVEIATIGPDWMLRIVTGTGVTDVAAPMPDPAVSTADMLEAHPPTQTCESVLPFPTIALDWVEVYGIGSSWVSSIDDGEVTLCAPACEDDVCGPTPDDAVVWWESATPSETEQLLADAEAGSNGLGIGGSTIDGDGTIVTGASETLVVLDDAIVHVDVPDGFEQSVQLARYVHAPGWPDLSPA